MVGEVFRDFKGYVMGIKYSIKVVDNILWVKASGRDDDINDVIQYGEALIKAAVEPNVARVLCDEKDLAYTIGTLDTFKAAEHIAKKSTESGQDRFGLSSTLYSGRAILGNRGG